jgi:hypothetical protein
MPVRRAIGIPWVQYKSLWIFEYCGSPVSVSYKSIAMVDGLFDAWRRNGKGLAIVEPQGQNNNYHTCTSVLA